MREWYSYEDWHPVGSEGWTNGTRPTSEYDVDAHVDLGCGKIKKGRIGVDRFWAAGVNVVMDLESQLCYGHATDPNSDDCSFRDDPPESYDDSNYIPRGLPFADSSIKSVISHHCLEHIGRGFVPLVEEAYRVLEPGGIFRAITPLFPSTSAVEDPDHRRYFMSNSWNFCQGRPEPGGHWHESFAVPYTTARFEELEKEMSPWEGDYWSPECAREIRVTLRAVK